MLAGWGCVGTTTKNMPLKRSCYGAATRHASPFSHGPASRGESIAAPQLTLKHGRQGPKERLGAAAQTELLLCGSRPPRNAVPLEAESPHQLRAAQQQHQTVYNARSPSAAASLQLRRQSPLQLHPRGVQQYVAQPCWHAVQHHSRMLSNGQLCQPHQPVPRLQSWRAPQCR